MFGYLSPLPIRFGGSPEEGLQPAEWNRLAADVAAARRVAPMAVLTLSRDLSGKVSSADGTKWVTAIPCIRYLGQNGTGSPSFDELFEVTYTQSKTSEYTTNIGTYRIRAKKSSWVDECGVTHPFALTGASACYTGSYPASTWGTLELSVPVALNDNGDILIQECVWFESFSARDSRWNPGLALVHELTVELFADLGPVSAGTYGADEGKIVCLTENQDRPLVADWKTFVEGARGSSYTTKSGSIVALENAVMARFFAGLQRLRERGENQTDPATASDSIPYWAGLLNMDTAGLTEWEVRSELTARMDRASRGPSAIVTSAEVAAVCKRLLGGAFVELTSPPDDSSQEFWPFGDVGSNWFDIQASHWSPTLGPAIPGVWSNDQMHAVIRVNPDAFSDSSQLAAFGTRLDGVLEKLLPSWMTWGWSAGTAFYLDSSAFDRDSL